MTHSCPSRSHFTKQRRKLNFYQRRRASRQAARQLNRAFLSRRSQHIGMYLDDFGELPTLPVFLWAKQRKKSLYLPVIVGNALKFRRIHYKHLRTSRLATHRLGMKEPKTGQLVSVESLDILFVPLVAADQLGNRMGMGGGYYDRTLAHVADLPTRKPLRVGSAYDFQVIDQLATHSWDVRLHQLMTPTTRYVF